MTNRKSERLIDDDNQMIFGMTNRKSERLIDDDEQMI